MEAELKEAEEESNNNLIRTHILKFFYQASEYILPKWLPDKMGMFIGHTSNATNFVLYAGIIYLAIYFVIAYVMNRILYNVFGLLVRCIVIYYINGPNLIDLTLLVFFLVTWFIRLTTHSVKKHHLSTMEYLQDPHAEERNKLFWKIFSDLFDATGVIIVIYAAQYIKEEEVGIPKQYVILFTFLFFIIRKYQSFGANSNVGLILYAMIFFTFVLLFPDSGNNIGKFFYNVAKPFRTETPVVTNSIPDVKTYFPVYAYSLYNVELHDMAWPAFIVGYALIGFLITECHFGVGAFKLAQLELAYPKAEKSEVLIFIGDYRFHIMVFLDVASSFYIRDVHRLVGIPIGLFIGYVIFMYVGKPLWSGAGKSSVTVPVNPHSIEYTFSGNGSNIARLVVIVIAASMQYERIGFVALCFIIGAAVYLFKHDRFSTFLMGITTLNLSLILLSLITLNPTTQHIRSSKAAAVETDMGMVNSYGMEGRF